MFVKPDKYDSKVIKEKAPRAIQFRHPRYNILLMRYIKAIEEHMTRVHLGGVSKTRVFVKGLNPEERAELFLHKTSRFINPVFAEADHAKFDSTIIDLWLQASHNKYLRMIPSKFFAKLLKMKIRNVGVTKHGIRYRTRGTRMSGDADTSCGNGMINGDAIYYVLYKSGITKYDIMIDGDDSIIILEKEDLAKFNAAWFATLGFITKLIIRQDIRKVEFCQSQLVLGSTPKFVRHPHRALTKIFACRHDYNEQQRMAWLAGVGMCEESLNYDMPLLGPIGHHLAGFSQKKIIETDLEWRMLGVQRRELGVVERQPYYETFGISPDLQIALEESVTSVKVGCRSRRLSNLLYYLENGTEPISRTRTWLHAMDESSSSCWWGCCSGGG